MSRDFKYGIKGFILAVLFIAAIKFFSFAYALYFSNKTVNADTVVKAPAPYFFVVNQRGKKLFENNCASCHSINKTDNIIHLESVEERVPSCELLYAFIRNSQQVIQSGNPYFIERYEEFGKIQMNNFPNLTDDNIDDILEYIHQTYENSNHKVSSADY